jgi:4-diphosphocytidyl-2-C-methyl-D-erythritol kinase
MERPTNHLQDTSLSVEGATFPAREKARAKVNLTLHVKGKRDDGYHELESLVVFAGVSDELTFSPSDRDSLVLTGPFAAAVDGENLVLRAKRSVADWLGKEISGAFSLRKNIPVAAGLGGGSSDAAAVIRSLLRIYGGSSTVTDLAAKAASIGADVPVCLRQRAAWMRGLGERVEPVTAVSALPAILVNPMLKLPTASVFGKLNAGRYALDRTEKSPIATVWSTPDEAAAELSRGRNDLEGPAIALRPEVHGVLETIRGLEGCLLARLSGSGPTCFGLFPSEDSAKNAAAVIETYQPHWWVAATTLS